MGRGTVKAVSAVAAQRQQQEERSVGENLKSSTKEHQPVSQFLAQLQFLNTNAWSIGNKEGELEVLVQSQGQDILGLSEMWWVGSQVWNAETNGYRLFRRDGQGRRGGITLDIREGLNCMELGNGNGRLGSLHKSQRKGLQGR